MAAECTDASVAEGLLPVDPEAAAVLTAAGLLLEKKITKQEWKARQRIRKTMFSKPKFRLQRYFLLDFVCCIHSPPLYRIIREREMARDEVRVIPAWTQRASYPAA